MISDQSQTVIKEFLTAWWADLSHQAGQTVIGADLPHKSADQLYEQPFGRNLRDMAAAAEGLLEWGEDLAAEILYVVQDLCEWMWARPGMGSFYEIPNDFWGAPIGYLALQAHVWARKDKLITIREAAELAGRSLADMSALVNRGRLKGYPDPNEPNPTRRTRVMLSEVETLPAKKAA